ncbi:MAG: bifunctional UDP-N-acetylglucosamine diphosphorylase/glucosamine-1-phosphate N-acetyltransferase GlmU [Thermodesulfobacteriota bacterium]
MIALILAAGKGTRMKSSLAKVLHEVHFRPMIHHVLDAVAPVGFSRVFVVVGHQATAVQTACAAYPATFVLQQEQLGTGHAVLAAERKLAETGGSVMILCGDTPLIRSETLRQMREQHDTSGAILTVMTTMVDNPANYGRIVEDDQGRLTAIVEERDATAEQRRIKRINAGVYCVDVAFLLATLKGVGNDNDQGEIYLTDVVSKAHGSGFLVNSFFCPNPEEALGVNSRLEQARAHHCLQQRFHEKLMTAGVSMLQPATISISPDVVIGRDTVLESCVSLVGDTVIGENCRIGHGSCLVDCRIGAHVILGPGSCVAGTTIDSNTIVPPGSIIRRDC